MVSQITRDHVQFTTGNPRGCGGLGTLDAMFSGFVASITIPVGTQTTWSNRVVFRLRAEHGYLSNSGKSYKSRRGRSIGGWST